MILLSMLENRAAAVAVLLEENSVCLLFMIRSFCRGKRTPPPTETVSMGYVRM